MAEDVSKKAPGDLEIVRLLINTRDVEDGTDELDAAWLRDAGVLDGELGAADLERTRELREALRDLLSEKADQPPGEANAVERLNALAARAPLTVAFDQQGHAHLQPTGSGFAAVAARLLAIVERAQADGSWERMKACAADTCRWAFYDQSRNRSRQWCDMAVCGNRAKARSYRKRTS